VLLSTHDAEGADNPAREDLPAIGFVLLAALVVSTCGNIRVSATNASPEQGAFPQGAKLTERKASPE